MIRLTKERFERRYIPEPNSGCWIWLGPLSRDNYGRFGCMRAHRYSYQTFNAIIPDGLFVLHKCHVPCCVNPKHLYAGTQKDNIHDEILRGTFKHNPHKISSHCLKGHLYTRRIDGRVYCPTCRHNEYIEDRKAL